MKLLKIVLSFCMLTCITVTKVNASQDNIQNYILSGSGTEDDPYILSRGYSGLAYYDEIVSQSIQPSNTMTLSDFYGNLTGTSHSGANNGAVWIYSSGGYSSTDTNGLMRINKISYCSYADTVYFVLIRNSSSNRSKLNTCLSQGLFGTALKNSLISLGVTSEIAVAAAGIFAISMGISSLVTSDITKAANASSQNHGMLVITYSITYQGDWYQTYCIDTWSTYTVTDSNGNKLVVNATAYEPISAYGTGVFTLKSSH